MQTKRRIQWFAVIAGSLLDNLLTLVIGGLGSTFAPEIAEGIYFRTGAGTLIGVLLALSTVAGGWLAGVIAREERFLHGFMVGGVGVLLLLLDSFAGGQMTADVLVLQFAATLLAGVAGYISRWTPVRLGK